MEGRGGARALLSGDERLGRGGARALRGVSGLRAARGGVLGLDGAAAASSELWLCMTASSSSLSTWRHLSKMEGILCGVVHGLDRPSGYSCAHWRSAAANQNQLRLICRASNRRDGIRPWSV